MRKEKLTASENDGMIPREGESTKQQYRTTAINVTTQTNVYTKCEKETMAGMERSREAIQMQLTQKYSESDVLGSTSTTFAEFVQTLSPSQAEVEWKMKAREMVPQKEE